MANIVLEGILAQVKDSDLKKFKDKIIPMEEAKAAELKAAGLRNINQIIEDRKTAYNLDYGDMGKETNVDGEALIVPSKAADDKTIDTRSGNEKFQEFLKKI